MPLKHQPGTRWHYSVSTDVLGRVIEVGSGQSLDQFFQKRIFEPLGMEDTFFTVPQNKRITIYMVQINPTGKLNFAGDMKKLVYASMQ